MKLQAEQVEKCHLANSFELLQFQHRTGWKPIPPWARFFCSLGASLLAACSPERRVVAAVSVPTLSFAAAFIALGRTLREPISQPAKSAIDAHFEKLASLPQKTPLIYFDGKALFDGPFLGTLKHSGTDFIHMALHKGTCMIPRHRCLLVEAQPESQTDNHVHHIGRLKDPKPFVSYFFSLIEHYRILCSTTKSVMIIGEKNRLRHELVQTPFAVSNDTGYVEGVLQDLIRIAQFSSGGIGCRGDVYARSRGHVILNGSSATKSTMIVLDGSAAYLRWAHEYSQSDTIAIFSRSESEYGNAIDSANARYLARVDDCLLPGLISPPTGIELMVHVETSK